MMLKCYLIVVFSFGFFLYGCNGDFNDYCQDGKAGDYEVKFEGSSGDFYRKVRTISSINQDSIDLICSEIKKLTPTFSNPKGSDFSITFRFASGESSIPPIEMYRVPLPEEKFVFWIGLKYYKNDTLAKLLMEIVNVDEIRSSDKYKTEKW